MSEIMEIDSNNEQSDDSSEVFPISPRRRSPTLYELIENLSESSDTTYVSESELINVPSNIEQSEIDSLKYEEYINEHESPSKKIRLTVFNDDDDSESCPICLDNWTTSGEHRLCSLKCGHLFGYNCLMKWLNTEAKKSCPTCKKRVYRTNEVRYIYARKIIAVDTTELTIAKDKMEEAIQEKNRMQIELSKAICRTHSLTQEVDDYKRKLNVLMQAKQGQFEINRQSSQTSNEIVSLYKEKTLDLGKNSGCRVFDCKLTLDKISVSIKSTNNLCSGFGVKMINISNYKSTAFILMHNQVIRDLKYHRSKPWLLSCSIDKKAKILDVTTNSICITLENESPLWSCCWGADSDNILYVGQQQGSVLQYDIRQPSEPISRMSIPGDFSPVVSVQAVKASCLLFPFGGVISCKLNSIWTFETTPQEPVGCPLPLEGPFISMSYQEDDDLLFLSSRPNSRYPYVRHFLCGLYREHDSVKCNMAHTLRGGSSQKMLTRTCLISNENDYAAAYIEDQRVVALWNINTGNKVGYVPAYENVLDLNSIKTADADFLLTLTDSKLEFFKFAN